MQDFDSDEIQRIVFSAFQEVPYPGDAKIATHHPCLECDEIARHFQGKDWKRFTGNPMELIGDQRDSLPLLDPEAYHFFLPAFLLASVLDFEEADIIPGSLAFEFSDPDPRNKECRDRLAPEQREAVWKTFQYLHEAHPGEFEDSELETIRQNLGIGER